MHRNVTIEENEFVLKGTRAVYLKSTADVTIRNNRVKMTDATAPGMERLTRQSNSTRVAFEGNVVSPESAV
ncbi:MAG: hypothetical protein HQ523_07670 [Lentisphaerae bacterium]|nr:hypothetical protein [Lentisphaerota bacterium]